MAPNISTGDKEIDQAFRIALGDIIGNLQPMPDDGALLEGIPSAHSGGDGEHIGLMAGLEYALWTRDASINSWNGLGGFRQKPIANLY